MDKLRKIIETVWYDNHTHESEGDKETIDEAIKEIKQLFKDMVIKAKPHKFLVSTFIIDESYKRGQRDAINQYEKDLLAQLEE